MNSNGSKLKYILTKVLQMIIVLVVLSMVVFVIARMCPGDPLKSYYGDGIEHMSEQQKEIARDNLGLNDSLVTQYCRWAENAIKGDWGISYEYKRPVTDVVREVGLNTLLLGGLSYIFTFVFAFLLGIFCSYREGKLADRIICRAGVIGHCIPTFYLALLSILVFAVLIPVFPTGGAYSYGYENSIADRLYHLILPVVIMVMGHLWYYGYIIRNKLIEETRQDYVLLCKVKGLSRKKILCRHCLRNIMPSMTVLMAISVPHILGGTYIVEMVFSYPGIGKLCFESAKYQDYNMMMALCLLTGAVVLVFNLAAQIINEFIDPRMKYESEEKTAEEEGAAYEIV